jgi:hypothetical protein
MSNFICVQDDHVVKPNEKQRNEYVIRMPDFMEEIKHFYPRMKSGKKVTERNTLRNIVNDAAFKYLKDEIAFPNIPYGQYEGIPYETEAELSAIIQRMVADKAPKLVREYLRCKIKERPNNIKLIWFYGDFVRDSQVFFEEGIRPIEKASLSSFLKGRQGYKSDIPDELTREEAIKDMEKQGTEDGKLDKTEV